MTAGPRDRQRLAGPAEMPLRGGAPYGDAVLAMDAVTTTDLPAGAAGPARCRAVSAEVVRQFRTAGEVPPIRRLRLGASEAAPRPGDRRLPANVPGGDEHNHTLESRYAGRIRRTA
jgi:uncharacterized phosphosugar-binding protein